MKKIIFLLLTVMVTTILHAEDGRGSITVNAGVLIKNTLNASIGYERALAYGQAVEVFGEVGNHWQHPTCHRFWKGYYWDFGGLYKYRLKRFKNGMLRFRVGPMLGSTRGDFYMGIEAGFEYSYVFRSGIQFCVVQKNNFNFLHGDNFRNGLLVGLKFPL